MALQLITGVSGSGKSRTIYEMASRIAAADRDKNVFVLVPEQSSHEASKMLVELNGGILNIDVLSIRRLSFRALEEFEGSVRTVLTDEGKIMLLRKVIAENKKELQFFTKGLDRPGFLDECKSLLSEFTEYGVGDDELDKLMDMFGRQTRSAMKIADLMLIYEKMKERMGDTYRMAEELVPTLTMLVPELSFLDGATVFMDDFTGFTPVQYELIGALMKKCEEGHGDLVVSVTCDRDNRRSDVFGLSNNTVDRLHRIAGEFGVPVKPPIVTGPDSFRLKNSKMLMFLEKHFFRYDGEVFKSDGDPDIRISTYRNQKAEAECIAVEIADLIKDGVAPESIAVVTGDMKGYVPFFERAFLRLGVPYFIDDKKSLGSNPLAEYIMSFLEMMRRGFDLDSVIGFLRGGLAPLSREETDILENYLIAGGRCSYKTLGKEWTYDIDGEYSKEQLDQINGYRQRLCDSISAAHDEIKGNAHTVSEFSESVCKLIIKNNLKKRLDDMAEQIEEKHDDIRAREYRKIYPSMMNLFDTMVDLMGDEKVTLKEYYEVLAAGVNGTMIAFVPPTDHQVTVGDIERTRLESVSHLFFVGNTDEIFPKGNGSVGILSDMERDKIEKSGIELAPKAEALYEREIFYMYRLLTKPSKKLYLSYAKLNGKGESLRPSYVIGRIKAMFDIREDNNDDVEPFFYSLSQSEYDINKKDVTLDEEIATRLYGDEISASVTRFESFISCPYSHFLNYGIRLKERSKYEVSPLDRGNIFHNSFERLSKKMMSKNIEWNEVEEDQLLELGKASFDEEAASYRDNVFGDNKRNEYILKRMKKIYSDMLLIMREQMRHGSFRQVASEASFPGDLNSKELVEKLSNGKTIRLRGRIDRIDAYDDGEKRFIKILDYKSSKKEFPLSRVYYGLEMQLMTYMSIVMSDEKYSDKENIPAAVLFQGLDEKQLKWKSKYESEEDYQRETLYEARPTGYVNEEAVFDLDDELSEGMVKSVAIPARNKKDTELYPDSKAMTGEDFNRMMDYTRDLIRKCAGQIYNGSIEARPYQLKAGDRDEEGCTFCPYEGVCGIENRTKSEMTRRFSELKDRDVLDDLEFKDYDYEEIFVDWENEDEVD